MDLFKDMKGPTRPAPAIPGLSVNRYSPVTNWDADPFGADVFEPPHFTQKKKPPPRPPPPKIGKQPEVPAKPSHFIRKPTVLSSLLHRKPKNVANQNMNVNQPILTDFSSELDPNKMFPKCEPKNVQTGALIDLSSPPSSPTFTTRSSSDGLSVDSFGSDATTSTNHHNANNGGNASQAESGFEDDFDLFLNTRKVNKEDTLDDFTAIDPFSPQPTVNKPPIMRKPVLSKDLYEVSSNFTSYTSQPAAPLLKGPTIIRAKPARPKPPDNSALLKTTFGGSFPLTTMTVNTTTPIQKVTNGFGDSFDSKPLSWDDEEVNDSCLGREPPSPPMPTIPPPPPPADVDVDVMSSWPTDAPSFAADQLSEQLAVKLSDHLSGQLAAPLSSQLSEQPCNGDEEQEEPHAIALFDYFTDHPDDLSFSANSKIKLIRRVDHEWLFGCLRSGAQGLFPSNYVEIKVPLPDEPLLGSALALYDFEATQPGDLRFVAGDTVLVRYKINDEWYFGECNNMKGQFPINYVEMS